ncbi:unnamed protein product [Paramecium primaurelia]|uniref:Uncharacterized protein n=1 Tax=Paramecium primaurelia TaxID=5886 RepID=A0A8S1K8V8_PARPR|nr:unnamed protein product [Paramecium primaurelia]
MLNEFLVGSTFLKVQRKRDFYYGRQILESLEKNYNGIIDAPNSSNQNNFNDEL